MRHTAIVQGAMCFQNIFCYFFSNLLNNIPAGCFAENEARHKTNQGIQGKIIEGEIGETTQEKLQTEAKKKCRIEMHKPLCKIA